MDGRSQMCDGPTGRPAIFVFQNLASGPGAPEAKFRKTKMAGRLVGPSHIWLPPSILGVYYWYWYIIGYNLMYFVYNPIICVLFA